MEVTYMVGSLSPTPLNKDLAKALVPLAPEDAEFVDLDVDSLLLYNRDYDGNWPEAATALKKTIDGADGAVTITSEHNRMYSTIAVNTVEWSSRPWGTVSFESKPVALAGVSPSLAATEITQTYLRGPLTLLRSKLYPHEACINAQQTGITLGGGVAEGSCDFLTRFIGDFADFVKMSK